MDIYSLLDSFNQTVIREAALTRTTIIEEATKIYDATQPLVDNLDQLTRANDFMEQLIAGAKQITDNQKIMVAQLSTNSAMLFAIIGSMIVFDFAVIVLLLFTLKRKQEELDQ
jgi:hypothetical protein